MNPALQDVVTQSVASAGFDVFAIRQRGTKNRPVLEVRILRRDGAAVSVNDCAQVSRAIEEQLDAGGSLGGFYTLEVSSPGIRDDTEINWKKR
jgi:ribosome maturation factor RimP